MDVQNITLTELKYRWTKPLADEIEQLKAEVEELTEKVLVHSSAAMENLKEVERLKAQVPRWIPVTERLPERADEVLIAYREEYDDWTEEYAVSTATYMPRAGRWDYDHLKITHWMPMPQPPKGGQE